MIFPNLFIFAILEIADEIVRKTSGTTIVNIRFKNISPKGFNTVAFSPKTIPIILPKIIEDNNIIGAKALVTKSIGDNGVFYGIPVKYIKDRDKKELI